MTNSIQRHLAGAALSCLGAFAATQAQATDVQVLTHTREGCQYFYTNCGGSQSGVSFKLINPNGEWQLDVTRFRESDHNVFFDKSVGFRDVASLHGTARWDLNAEGTKAHLKKQFYLGDNAGVSLGVYLGKLSAHASAEARIDGHVRATTINIPEINIPAVPRLGTPAYNIPASSLHIPEINRTLYRHHEYAEGQSPYGGFTLDNGYSHAFGPRVTGILGKSGTLGVDGIWGSLNAGVIISSSGSHNTRTPMGDICQGQAAFPKHGINFIANLCVRRDVRHPLYDLEREKMGDLANRINNRLNESAGRVHNATGYRPDVPQYTGDDLMQAIGIESPYRWQPRLQFSLAGRSGNLLYSATIEQPLGRDKHRGRTFSAVMGYEF